MKTLKSFQLYYIPYFIVSILIWSTSCTGTSRKAEENLELLRLKTLALDSIIDVESRRMQMLDSSINYELKKAGKLDSMISAESLRIDSLVTKVYNEIKQKNN